MMKARDALTYHTCSTVLQVVSKFDDRKGTIKAHIEIFEKAWLCLALVTPSASTPDGAIVHFTKSDTWKAYTLINSFPHIQSYIKIIDNITSKEDSVTYANTVLHLKEISERPSPRRQRESDKPTAAFSTEDRAQRFCGYCKKAGWPGTSHNEVDCNVHWWQMRCSPNPSANHDLSKRSTPTTHNTIPNSKITSIDAAQ